MSNISNAIDLIFQNRRDFIIVGLTGRTGSGCSTVADILSQEKFETLYSPKPIVGCCEDNEERKYNIAYNYLKQNWKQFNRIRVTDIITSFLLENEFKMLIEYLKEKKYSISILEKLQQDLETEFNLLYKDTANGLINKKGHQNNDEIYQFYSEKVSLFSDKIRHILDQIDIDVFTNLYQEFGNNIRKSGMAFDNKFGPENIYKIAERTNKLIKILRHSKKDNVIVVIDALRNPFEVNFFKDRYSAFYLFSINTEEEMRQHRLIQKGLNVEQITKIDEEYTKKLSGEEQFYSLNIKGCLELADVHIYNPTEQGNNYDILKKQIIRYITLIMHPGIIPPTHLERCMQIAYNAKLNSGCLSRQVGAVVTAADYSIKSVGWNSSPEGHIPCILRNLKSLIEGTEEKAFSNYELYNKQFRDFIKENYAPQIDGFEDRLEGRLFSYCFKDAQNALKSDKNQVHTRSLHAEENAFLQIAKNGGTSIKGGYLFTTASPCELCAKKAYHLGIARVYYIDPYPGISKEHILSQGNNRPDMILFHGAIGRAYNQFYTPIMPYKDELSMLLDFKYCTNKAKNFTLKRKIKWSEFQKMKSVLSKNLQQD
ncbi:MAG: hypothetical protein LLG02_09670 [Pelosinus sp.]|nr:hypothetical protein [Pelosinus sp.]